MRFLETSLAGFYTIKPKLIEDTRGAFARWYCEETFKKQGLDTLSSQANLAHSYKAGTMRGLHLQHGEASEAKLVRCTKGSLFDVVVDCRQESPTFLQHEATILSAADHTAVYVPKGFAHGYLTLEDNTEITYMVSDPHQPGSEAGLRYDDPMLAIEWPREVASISDKDTQWPLLKSTQKGMSINCFSAERLDQKTAKSCVQRPERSGNTEGMYTY